MSKDMRIVAMMVVLAVAWGGSTGVQAWPYRELVATPPNTTDFGNVNASFFTFLGLQNVTVKPGSFATLSPASTDTGFAALSGLDISNALVTFPPGTVNPPHIHPRGTETIFVLEGTLHVGLLDLQNNLFTTKLEKGGIFVVPRAWVHFQINRSKSDYAQLYASFSSSSPGRITLPKNLFGSTPPIETDILAESFGVSTGVIEALLAAQTTNY